MDITVEQEGYITDVSPPEAIILLGPHILYEEGRPFPVLAEDSITTADVIFQDDITFA